jgi:anti-sigma regulatory factor (Ser/Thr protein kinase)
VCHLALKFLASSNRASPVYRVTAWIAGVSVEKRGLLFDLALVSDPHLLSVVRAAIEKLTEVAGFSPPECRAITRAVDEALANVIRHAYGSKLDERIEISCKKITREIEGSKREALEIELLDWGAAMDPEKLNPRSLDEVRPGGLGLHFIRDSMDIVERRRVEGANQLRLAKFLSEKESIKDHQGE